MDRDDVGCPVRLAGFERDLARVEQFAELKTAATVRQSFGQDRVVATPRQVRSPHRAVPFPEAHRAGEHERRVFVGGAAAPVLEYVRAIRPRHSGRVELPCPTAGERAELSGVLRHRQGDRQRVEQVALVGADVGQLRPDDERVVELERDVERKPGGVVACVDHEPAAVEFVADAVDRHREPGCPRRAPSTVAEQARPAGVTGSVLRNDGQRADDVDRTVHQRAVDRRSDVAEGVDRCAPVHDRRGTRRRIDEHITRAAP